MDMLPPPPRIRRASTALGLDDPRLRGLLGLLWLTTAVYVLLHLTRRLVGVPASPFFDLATEHGYGEALFQMLTGWSVILLVLIAVRTRAWIMIIWAVFAVYLLADDYFTLHEQFGIWFAENVMNVGSLSDDLGEAVWLLGIGVLLIISILIGYRFSSVETRRRTMILAALFGALAFFGVAVDIVHSLLGTVPFADALFIALEDGGEIAVMSVLVVYLMSLAFPARTASAPPAPR